MVGCGDLNEMWADVCVVVADNICFDVGRMVIMFVSSPVIRDGML